MKRSFVELALIFALAFALRFGLLEYRLGTNDRTPLEISPQAIEYVNLGKALLYRGEWSAPYFAARPPLMPLMIAGMYAIFGESQMAVAMVNVTLGALTAVMAYGVASSLAGDVRAARLAGVLVAIDPASIANNINLQAEALTNFCLAVSVFFLARLATRQKVSDAVLAGLCLSLAMLARPTTLYLFVFCLPLSFVLLRLTPQRSGNVIPRWRWLWLYLAFAALPVLSIAGWSARNRHYMGEFTFSTVSDFNMLFYRAVSVERWALGGKSDDVIRREFAVEVERRMGKPIDPSRVDSGYFWMNIAPQEGQRVKVMRQMALEVFAAHPLWYVATIPVGLYHMYAYTDTYGSPFVPELLYNLLLYAASAWGAGVCWKRRDWPTLWIALTVIGYITLATMISQTTGMDTRMRTSTTVALAVLAAMGVAPLFRPRRDGRGFVERPRLDEWKPERETRSFSECAAHLQPSTVRLHDPSGNRKPQSGAARRARSPRA